MVLHCKPLTKRFNITQVEAVMFGSLLTVTDADLAILLTTGIVISAVFAGVYNQLLLDSLDPALARVNGVPSAFLDYLVLLLTAAIERSARLRAVSPDELAIHIIAE